MNWNTILHAPWKSNLAANEETLDSLRSAVPFDLPLEYFELLRWSDGGEGTLGSVYLNVWSSVEVLSLNNGYQILQFLPNAWVVGDDSSHFYAYEQTAGKGVEAIRFPMGFMHPSAVNVRLPNLKTMFTQLESGDLF